jgi:hypothetical protein
MFQIKVAEKIKIHRTITSPENRAVCEIIWKNIEQAETPEMTR